MLWTIKNSQQTPPLVKEGVGGRFETPKYTHLWNSAGTLKYNSSQTWCNARRCWLALYGYNPLPYPSSVNLQSAIKVTSTVISTQQLKTGDIVSYGGKRTTPHPCFTATLPFWYFEWLPRNVTNKRGFSHDWLRHPQIWTICMNLSCYTTWMIELPIWTKVTLIWQEATNTQKPKSWQPTTDNWQLLSLASLSSTIPYEILTSLHPSIRRIIVE